MTPSLNSTVTLSWYDYTIFVGTLVFSTMIGIYYGCFGTKQATMKEYLMGGKTMKIVPIAISVAVSHISGSLLLGTAADVFRYGASVWLVNLSFIVMGLANFVYLPVFFKLRLRNIYDYLEKRFDSKTRLLAIVFYLIAEILIFPVHVYTPSLTLATASGFNVNLVAFILSAICVFYTSVGGFKTVIWTDFLQFGIIMASFIIVYVIGLRLTGGFLSVWNTALAGERLQIFNFDVNPTVRDSFWGYLIGGGAIFAGYVACRQTGAQKFLTLPKSTDIKWSIIYTVISMAVVHTLCIFVGLVVYAKYKDCDPLTSHKISKHDQIFPYFVTEIGGTVPGLSGLFIAAICCGSLSSMSSNLNAISGVIYKDIVYFFLKKELSDKSSSGILKVIVLVVGTLCTCLVFTVELLGDVFSVGVLATSLTQGPLLGVFTLGIFVPKANPKGAFYGMLGGFTAAIGLTLPAKYYELKGLIKYPTKPLSISGCGPFNQTTNFTSFGNTALNDTVAHQPPSIFKITFYYYTFFGAIMTIVFGLIISYMSKSASVDRKVLSPLIYRYLPDEGREEERVSCTGAQETSLNLG
ncbi:sodium-coupled monocarboxylate transporter 1-like [Zophobas morio]|uniref:sodium-coupled monocarboxylate transporter 1-like n=1 Tax=Zophobas morio TaxID=2755281 RepID=UPI0030830D97